MGSSTVAWRKDALRSITPHWSFPTDPSSTKLAAKEPNLVPELVGAGDKSPRFCADPESCSLSCDMHDHHWSFGQMRPRFHFYLRLETRARPQRRPPRRRRSSSSLRLAFGVHSKRSREPSSSFRERRSKLVRASP